MYVLWPLFVLHSCCVARWSTANAPIIEFHGSIDTTIPIEHALAAQAEYNRYDISSVSLLDDVLQVFGFS